MITTQTADEALDTLSAIPFFPSEIGARSAINHELLQICSTEEQMIWLARRCLTLFMKWPGVPGMRAVACSKFKPKDGIELDCCIEYPDGIPSEKPEFTAISSPDRRAIETTADPELGKVVKRLAEGHAMPRPTSQDIAAVRQFYDKDGDPK